MQRAAPRSFLILALTVFAWLAGTSQHAAMGIGHALGGQFSAICSVDGVKLLHSGGPAQPAKPPAGGDCQACAYFGAPVVAHAPAVLAAIQFAAADARAESTAIHKHHTERRTARGPPQAA